MRRPRQKNKRLILGLTGSFGSGKTTVAGIFKVLGAEVVDADKIAHQAILPKGQVYRKLVQSFGRTILKKDRKIDRAKLASLVFDNKNLVKKINRITHPYIIRIIKEKIRHTKSKVIILDAPLLVEAGLEKMVDQLIVVKITRSQQIARLLKKTSLNKAQILRRISCQMPLLDKAALADFIIDNSDGIQETKKQVKQIGRLLWKN